MTDQTLTVEFNPHWQRYIVRQIVLLPIFGCSAGFLAPLTWAAFRVEDWVFYLCGSGFLLSLYLTFETAMELYSAFYVERHNRKEACRLLEQYHLKSSCGGPKRP